MKHFFDNQEIQFKKTLRWSIGFYFLLALGITWIHLPQPKEPDLKFLSDRVAKLILEPPMVVPPPPVQKTDTPKRTKKDPKKTIIKPKKVSPPSKPTAQQNREIIRKSGLLASLIEEERSGAMDNMIKNKRLDQALTSVEMVSASSKSKTLSPLKKSDSHKSTLADKKLEGLGSLSKNDRVILEKEEGVTVSLLSTNRPLNGSSGREIDLGEGVGIRLRGGKPNPSNEAIDYDAIARVVEKYKSSLIYLYNKELRSKPTLKGTITVEFSIDPTGKVVETRIVTSSMDHRPLEKALAHRIKMWKFPKLYDGLIVVTYPFVFFPV